MNRLSELQTIVKVSKICNNNGLTKEADQLLNIFTKLAQENLEVTETSELEAVKPIPEIDKDLESKLDDFKKSSDELLKEITDESTPQEIKQLLPEVKRIVDLSRVIFDNPNLDEYNKKILAVSLPELAILQETIENI